MDLRTADNRAVALLRSLLRTAHASEMPAKHHIDNSEYDDDRDIRHQPSSEIVSEEEKIGAGQSRADDPRRSHYDRQ